MRNPSNPNLESRSDITPEIARPTPTENPTASGATAKPAQACFHRAELDQCGSKVQNQEAQAGNQAGDYRADHPAVGPKLELAGRVQQAGQSTWPFGVDNGCDQG